MIKLVEMNYIQCIGSSVTMFSDWPAPFQTSYFIGPYNLHYLLFSRIWALLCRSPSLFFPSKSQTLFGIGTGPPMFLESIGSHLTLFKCNWMLEIYCNVMNNTCMNVVIIAKPLTPEYKHWIIYFIEHLLG